MITTGFTLALRVVRQSGGGACAVTDDEAIAGVKLLARTEGIFAEAAGGVVIGALGRLVASGVIKQDELVVACIAGAGPRTQDTVVTLFARSAPSLL